MDFPEKGSPSAPTDSSLRKKHSFLDPLGLVSMLKRAEEPTDSRLREKYSFWDPFRLVLSKRPEGPTDSSLREKHSFWDPLRLVLSKRPEGPVAEAQAKAPAQKNKAFKAEKAEPISLRAIARFSDRIRDIRREGGVELIEPVEREEFERFAAAQASSPAPVKAAPAMVLDQDGSKDSEAKADVASSSSKHQDESAARDALWELFQKGRLTIVDGADTGLLNRLESQRLSKAAVEPSGSVLEPVKSASSGV